MEIRKEDEIEDMSLSLPTMGSMQIAGSNGFGHNIEFMSQAYLRNRYSEIDIEADGLNMHKDHPLPIFLKVMLNLFASFSVSHCLCCFCCKSYDLCCSLKMWCIE